MKKIIDYLKTDIKQHKKLYVFIVIMAILCACYTQGVFAGDTTLDDTMPDFAKIAEKNGYDVNKYPYYIVLYYKDDSIGYDYICYFSDQPITCCSNPNDKTSWKIECHSKSSLMLGASSNDDYKIFGVNKWYAVRPNITYFLYANHSIKNTDTNTTFFHASPLPSGQIHHIGTSITTQTISNQMLTQVLSLIPLVVGLVISFLALRKALVALARCLKKA